MTLPVIRLQAQRHKRVATGHPWIYSNEIENNSSVKTLPPGSVAQFVAHDNTVLGIGTFNPHTLIAGRIFSRSPLATLDVPWFLTTLRQALTVRQKLIAEPYYRLVHAEADGLPGLIIDRFKENLSVQLNTAGMEHLWPQIMPALAELLQPKTIVLHNDSSVRALEGLERTVKMYLGELKGPIEVRENDLAYYADLFGGQKTGWYFDQRDNHALVARYASGSSVLDLYCHAGGFGLLAAKAGAKCVVGVDSSQPALDLAVQASKKNKLDKICSWQRNDAFADLEQRMIDKELYDIVVADPPPFVKSRKDVVAGARGYRKLARMSASVTAKNGLLFIASCSHNMALDAFTEEVARGLFEARRTGRIIHTVFAAPDHPVHPHLPESSYLKGLLIQLD